MFSLKHITRYSLYATKHATISKNFINNLTISHAPIFKIISNKYLFRSLYNSQINYHVSNKTINLSEAFLNLDNNYKEQLRIKKSDIEQLISCIENEDVINDDKYLLLLQCCGHLIPDEIPSTKISLAEDAWQKFINKKIKLKVEHYNALLQCYVENRMILSHKEFLDNMSCEPNVQTYDLLLQCICESGDSNQAVEIVNIMKEKGFSANEPVFSSLILCHLRNGDIKSAQNILSTMRIAHIQTSSNTFTALLRGYVESNEIDLFKNTLNKAQNINFNLHHLISILNAVCLSEHIDLLPLIKKILMPKLESRIFESKLQNLCVNLIYLKKPKIAYELHKSLTEPEVGFSAESDTYGSFLFFELIKSESPSEIIVNIADDLIKTKRNIYALHKATEISLRIPDVKVSLILLQALYDRKHILKNHYFWPILIHEARLLGEKGIFNIFNEMQKYNIDIEAETLEVYSLQYIKNMDPDNLINKLKQFNLTVTDVLTSISVVLLREGKTKLVADMTNKYQVKIDGSRIIKQLSSTYSSTNDVQNVIKILKNIQLKNTSEDWAGQLISLIFTRSGANINYKQIFDLLTAYKQNNIKVSASFVDKIDYYSKKIQDNDLKNKIQKVLFSLESVTDSDRSNHIPHPRNMTLEELECHLIELRDKQMEIRGVLRKLIQTQCRIGNLDRVTKLLTEFKTLGYGLSPGIKSSLLYLFLKTEQFENALKVYNDIKENSPTFIIDEFKVVDLARLFYVNNKFSEATSLLQDESANRKILGGHTIEHNCWRLLDTVAKTGKVEEVNLMFKALVDSNFCTESNIILGPLIRVHIVNNNKTNAAEEYVNCCTKYNKTPLLHELMCYLVKNESSSELIQKVIEATVNIHGAVQTQTTLAAALAESGLTKTLRKLFIDSDLQLSQKSLEQYCQRWINENKIHALKNLIKGAEGLVKIDLSVVYLNLLKNYSSNNENDTALNLWNEMQEKNVVVTEEIKNLVDSLISQKNCAENRTSL